MKINIRYESGTYTLDEDCDLSEKWVWNCSHEDYEVVKEDGDYYVNCSNESCEGISEQLEVKIIEDHLEDSDYQYEQYRDRQDREYWGY